MSPKFYQNVCFVDARYTSRRCPKCGIFGKKVTRKGKNDTVHCEECKYKSGGHAASENLKKISVECAHNVISTGDENGAFFIGFRCLNELTDC